MDTWLAPARPARAEIREGSSRFLGDAIPIDSETDAAAHLARLTAEFPRATHHCWGFRLVTDQGGVTRSSDAGEPPGTAGAPILRAITSAGMEGASLVVVRWFGGIKLGVGPLSRAYRQAAGAALQEAGTERRCRVVVLCLRFPWPASAALRRVLDRAGAEVREEPSGGEAQIVAGVPAVRVDEVRRELTDAARGRVQIAQLGFSSAKARH